jgi:hypothetical protein
MFSIASLRLMRLSLLVMLLQPVMARADGTAAEARLDEVQKRGSQVMPFSLERTVHIFTKTDKGGIQQVVVKEITDAEQIGLIRAHLSEIAQRFAQGDFSAPAQIHGEYMPGLATLRSASPRQIGIEYEDLANGGQIVYSTDDPGLIEAIHRWFDAQLKDHARHAVPGHSHDPSHHQH